MSKTAPLPSKTAHQLDFDLLGCLEIDQPPARAGEEVWAAFEDAAFKPSFGTFEGAPPVPPVPAAKASSTEPFGAFESAAPAPTLAAPTLAAPTLAVPSAPALPRVSRASTDGALADFSAFVGAPAATAPAATAPAATAPAATAPAPTATPPSATASAKSAPATPIMPAFGAPLPRLALGAEFIDMPSVVASRRVPCMAGPRVHAPSMFGAVRA